MRLVPLDTIDGYTALTRVTLTGTTTSGSAVVTGLAPSTSTIFGALGASGTGLPSFCYVKSIDSSNQVTLNQPATASGTVEITFTIEPVSLAEAKAHARVELADDDPAGPMNDALIAGFIRGARMSCETLIKSALIAQRWTLYEDSFPSAGGYYTRAIREVWPSMGSMPSGLGFMPGMVPNSTGVINIPLPPTRSVESVKYYDFAGVLQTVPPSTYNVSLGTNGRIQPAYSKVWPIARPTIDCVEIAFTAGFGPTAASVPDNVKIAICMIVAGLYEQREHIADGSMIAVPQTVQMLLAATDPGIYA